MPNLLDRVNNTWGAILIILAIFTAGIKGWWAVEAKASEVAEKTTRATVNKEMVDGAKKAAKEAVEEAIKEQLPAIAKQVAKETADQVVKQQRDNRR